MIAAAAIAALAFMVLWPITSPVVLTGAVQADGLQYAAAVRALGGSGETLLSPYGYRVFPPALVAASGLGAQAGYLVLNVLASLAAAALLYRLFRRYGDRRVALVAVAWWAMLPTGIRFFVYYPQLNDATGFLLLVALTVAALESQVLVFALVLPFALLTRENLLLLVPFLWLRLHAAGRPRAELAAVAAALPGLAALAWIHLASPVRIVPTGIGDHMLAMAAATLTNTNAQLLRYLAALPMTLGAFLAAPLARPRAALDFLRREVGWTYLLGATLAFAVLGEDRDRYFLWLVPALGSLGVAIVSRTPAFAATPALVAATLLHAVAVRFAWPLGTTEADAAQYATGFMDPTRLIVLGALATAACFVLVAGARAALRRRPALLAGRRQMKSS